MKIHFSTYLLFSCIFINHLYGQWEHLGTYDTTKYNWLHPELNVIQYWNRNSLQNFYDKWHSQEPQKISIVWMGDSHIQPDVLPEVVRKRLQEKFGDAGRGMMFPLSTGRTYSSLQYKSEHYGPWACSRSIEAYPKFTLGVSGATCKTQLPGSSFTLSFYKPVPNHYTILKVFCKKSKEMFDFSITVGSNTQIIKIMETDTNLPYILVKIPPIPKSITLKVLKNRPEQKDFEFYGMSLESENPGVVVHTCGIGGAQMSAPLYQKKFTEQLPKLDPDLIILDYGGNDFYYFNSIRPDLESDIIKIIQQIREVSPKTSILLTSTQDLMKHGASVSAGKKYRDLIQKIAKEHNCGFYDWYYISGGPGAMTKWVKAGLAQPDYVHLFIGGYQVKGEMFYEALMRTYEAYKSSMDSLVTSLEGYQFITQNNVNQSYNNTQNKNMNTFANKKSTYHIVKSGETLSHIAVKYKVRVNDIMKWNNLKSTLIRVGQKLVIYQ